jgi:copper chaperone CopZ
VPTLKLCVQGMQDAGEEAPLAEALLAEDGVLGAVVSADARCAEIDFEDDRVSIEQILAIIEARGYQASLSG